jgi:hypothetical protein
MRTTIAIIVMLVATPALAQSQPPQAVERAYVTARAVSPTPLSIDRERAAWLMERAESAAVADTDEQWRAHWAASADRDITTRGMVVLADDLAQGCIDIRLGGCTSPSGGYVPMGEHRLFWQLQEGSTPEDGVGSGFVLLAGTQAHLNPAAWDFEGVLYEPPVVFRQDDSLYVAVAGRSVGTGSFNVDRLFRWVPNAPEPLVQIDNETWLDTLDQHLPPGLSVWKGVAFNYPSLSAETALWRDQDGNCCPTGGQAVIGFEIRGNALVVTDVESDVLP